MGLLQSLLGREGTPNLPDQVDDTPVLVNAFNEAQGVDPEKRRRIAEILSGKRTSDDAARGPQPAGPMTPGDSSANPEFRPFQALEESNKNPFAHINTALTRGQ